MFAEDHCSFFVLTFFSAVLLTDGKVGTFNTQNFSFKTVKATFKNQYPQHELITCWHKSRSIQLQKRFYDR